MPLRRNRFFFGRVPAHFWALCGGLLGCTTPTFELLDAGAEEAAAPTPDASGPGLSVAAACGAWGEESALAEGARGLLGRYAVRLDRYGFADISAIHAREHERKLMVAEITDGSDALHMNLRTCEWGSDYSSFGTLLTATNGPVDLSSMPPRTLALRFGPGCSWSAAPLAAQAWGYDAASPVGCTAGATLARSTQQSWLLGECNCAADDAALPADSRDCRVTDPDADGNPGVTVRWQSEEFGSERYFVAIRDESTFVAGKIDSAELLTAREQNREQSAHLGGDFARLRSRCPEATSKLTLKRLLAEVGDDACAAAARVFWAESEPAFPERECQGS